MFLGMLITIHYVRTLCDKYCFELWWFLWTSSDFWQESEKIGFINMVYREKVFGPKEDCWIGLHISMFDGYSPHYNATMSPRTLMLQVLLIVETWNLCHWIWHTLNPKYAPLKPFNAFAQSKSTKCIHFGCLHNSPWQKCKKTHQNGTQGGSAQIGFHICTYRLMGMLITMHYVMLLCLTSTFWCYHGFSELPLTETWKKNINVYIGKSVWHRLEP